MPRALPAITMLAAILGASAAAATTCNIDLRNTGTQTAYDLALVLPGQQTINQWYNGTSGCDDVFSTNSTTQSGGNTILHWTNPASPIAGGASSPQVHVGWTNSDNTCPSTITGYWTDQSGNQISGSFVGIVVDHVSSTEATFTNTLASSITIAAVRYAHLASAISLSALNRCNQALVAQLQSISADPVTLKPGDVLHVPLPNPPCYECNVVLTYEVSGAAFDAVTDPWVEDLTPAAP